VGAFYARRRSPSPRVRNTPITKTVNCIVPPHVSHFMQVPFRTSLKCRTRCTSQFRSSSPRRAGFGPSCTSRFSVGENRCSGSAVFSAVAVSPWPRRAVGPGEVDRGEVATSTDIGLAGPGRRQGVRLGIGFNSSYADFRCVAGFFAGKNVGGASAETKAPKKSAKKPRKAAAGQKEMLMPIAGKKQAKEAAAFTTPISSSDRFRGLRIGTSIHPITRVPLCSCRNKK
jgi:hypothetical protein